MKNILEIIKANIIIIILATLVSLVTIFPQVYFKYKTGKEYKGVPMVLNDDELYYISRGQEILDGHTSLGNPYIYELKDKPTIQFSLPDYIVTKSLHWTGMNITDIFFAYDILFPFIITILTYICFILITRSRFWSLMGSALLIFGIFFYFFNRPISPQFNFIFYLSMFIFLVKYIQSEFSSKKYLLLSIVNLGCLFYFYTYFWTFYVVILITTAFVFICKREYKIGLKFLSIFTGGVFLGFYYFINMWNSSKLPEYSDTLSRLGMINSHFPSGIFIVLVGLVVATIFVLLWWRGKILESSINIFLFCGVISGIIVMNQHLITGKDLEFSSHYYLPIFYWLFFVIIYILNATFDYRKKIGFFFLICICSFMLNISYTGGHTVVSLYRYFNTFSVLNENDIYSQKYREVFDWLNSNTKKDDVVFSNNYISEYIPAYTHNNIFYSRSANLHFMTDDDVLDRFLISNYYNNFDTKFVNDNHRAIYGVRFVDQYGHDQKVNRVLRMIGLKEIPLNYFPEDAVNRVVLRRKEIIKAGFLESLKKYKVDYFVVNIKKDFDFTKNIQKNTILVWSNNDFKIYKFNN